MLRQILTATIMMAILPFDNARAWELVADRINSVPLENVVCLLSSDASDRMTVVCENGSSLYDVARISFVSDSSDAGVESTVIAGKAMEFTADNTIVVTGLRKPDRLRVYSSDGKCCVDKALPAAEERQTVDISGLSSGVYIAEIKGVSIKLVKR